MLHKWAASWNPDVPWMGKFESYKPRVNRLRTRYTRRSKRRTWNLWFSNVERARARYPQAPELWRVAFGSILYCKDTVSTCVYYRWFPLYTLLGFTFVKNGLLRFTWHFHKGTSFLIIVIFIFLKRKHLIIVLLLLVRDLFNPSRRFPLKTVEEWFTLFVRLVLDGSESTGSVKNCSSISIVHISCFRIL